MNRKLKLTSNLIRTLLATAALVASGLVVGSTVSLADHYASGSAAVAHAVVAQR